MGFQQDRRRGWCRSWRRSFRLDWRPTPVVLHLRTRHVEVQVLPIGPFGRDPWRHAPIQVQAVSCLSVQFTAAQHKES